MHLCFRQFWQLFPFFVFSCLETKFKIPHISHKFFSKAPFHKNPPSFNTLLLSNGQYKNERKLNNGLKHLFGDLVSFGRHMITWSLPGVNPAIHLCFRPFQQLFLFSVFPSLETKFKFPDISHTNFPKRL